MVSTSKKQAARHRARQARLRIDAERADRDKKIEDAATTFFAAVDDRDELMAKVRDQEERMDGAIAALHSLGESQTRIAELLGVDRRRVRQARAGESGQPATETASSGADRHRD